MTQTFIKIGATQYDTSNWELPTDRTFRDAWTVTSTEIGVIEVNMESAREIWRNKIRLARTSALAALDTEYMKALETSADTTEIIAKKQALRDAPAHPSIDEATSPELLKLVQPAGLRIE